MQYLLSVLRLDLSHLRLTQEIPSGVGYNFTEIFFTLTKKGTIN